MQWGVSNVEREVVSAIAGQQTFPSSGRRDVDCNRPIIAFATVKVFKNHALCILIAVGELIESINFSSISIHQLSWIFNLLAVAFPFSVSRRC